jgi:DNA polymerase-3 subunit delta
MTPDQALREASENALRPVYLVTGEERHVQAQVLSALRDAALAGATPGLNEDQFTAGEASVDAVLGAARTLPMFAKRRLVVVRALERWEGTAAKGAEALEQLTAYAKDPSPSTVLLLVAGKLDKRKKLAALAFKQGFAVSCEPLSRGDLPRWIETTAKARGNPLAAGVADLLAELAGPELSSVADALERVCLYAGEGETISEEAVAECVVRVRPTTVWELVGAVGRRDVGGALAALERVYDPHDRGLRLVGILAWSTRQLLRFESAMRGGARPDEAAKRAGAPPFKARELSAQVQAIPRRDLERWLELLARVDLALKGGSKRPPKAVLEHAILSLCQETKARPRQSRGKGA